MKNSQEEWKYRKLLKRIHEVWDFIPWVSLTWTVTFQIVLIFRVHPSHYDDGGVCSTCCHDSHSRGMSELYAYCSWEIKGANWNSRCGNFKKILLIFWEFFSCTYDILCLIFIFKKIIHLNFSFVFKSYICLVGIGIQ